ncbi:Ig-like domain-containing protein [Methanobacterium aggregans]|uniref:Ig-like domain-containing protein n=1 Tax=Methanobacterium aggregans TaxID=1615586 RepID=UPI00320C331E
MGGDGRVSNKATTNSALLTLLNSDLSLTKLSGNSQFQVTSKTIERTPNQKFSQFNQEASWTANSAGAGSVMIKGIINSVSFKWTGTGIEGMGQDGIELVWDLTQYVDNTAPVVTSSLNPNTTRSGNTVTLNAHSSPDTTYIVANTMGNLYSMNKGSDNNWNLDFTVPDAADGIYNVLLMAFDGMGNMGTSITNFTVDNTPPTINASCTPVLTRTGNSILVNATADDDTASMTLEVLGTIYNMIKDPTGTWIFNYTVPGLVDGTYDMLLTATDALGNTGNNYLNFTVDNTPPALVGDLNQTTARTGDNLTLNVSADNDTNTLTATILGEVYNLTKDSDGLWTLQYTIPQVADGLYTILLTGTDTLGNMGNTSLNFTVDNTPPSINGSVLPELTKTGNSVLLKAAADPDTVRMTATILGTTYNMIQSPDGIWTLQYTVPQVADGLLGVFLDAWDSAGNHGCNTTNMTVDNALPGVNCTVLPGRAKNGGNVTLRVCADPDVVNVTAIIAENHYNLTQNSDGTWTLKYPIQGFADGFQTVLLTATNGLGSQGTAYTGFTVDNTAPALKAELLPSMVREGGKLFVRVYSDVDAVAVTAEILGKTYNLIKGSNSIWTLPYTVPGLKDGNYNVMLRGWDDLNNTNNTTLAFKVQNPVTPVNHGSLGGSSGSSTSTVHSASQGYSNGVPSVQGGSFGSAVAGKVVSPVVGGLSARSSSSSGLLDGFLSYEGNGWYCNVKGSVYGGSAAFLENPFNPFFYQFYTWDKLIQAGQKAWSTGNVWDFFNYDFFHFYGYSNLDHVWGGENIKWFLDNFVGIDVNGNMSVGSFLLNLLTIIPIGKLAAVAGRLLARYLPKFASTLIRSKAVQVLLKNKTVQKILKGANKYLINPLKWLEKLTIAKFWKYLPKINGNGIVEGVKRFSGFVNLSPRVWVESVFSGLSRSSLLRRVGLRLEGKVFSSFKLWGKVLPREIPSIVGHGVNVFWKGVKGGVDSLLDVFSDMTPLAVKKWVHSSPWRMKTFSKLGKVVSTKFYRNIHSAVSPIIKRNVALRSVYNAGKTVYKEYKQVKKQGIRKYVHKKIQKYVKPVYKRYIKPVYRKYVKPVVKQVVSAGKKVYSGAKNAWNGFKKWIGWK